METRPRGRNIFFLWLVLLLLRAVVLISTATAAAPEDHNIAVNCGSSPTSTAPGGREWLGEKMLHKLFTIKGSSSSVVFGNHPDPLPYATARASREQFSYSFRLNPGEKFIRLHFNPRLYKGFESFSDYFTVEAGQFTLLSNFSASMTARALGLNSFAREFCLTVEENQPLDIVFTPNQSPLQEAYAFINGIEIISLTPNLPYCQGGDAGVEIVGARAVAYIDNSTALEVMRRVKTKVVDDAGGMFGIWGRILKQNEGVKVEKNNSTWRTSVDVGFRYMIRIHFSELGLNIAETGGKDFVLVINGMIASTAAGILEQRKREGTLWYKNYMLVVNGHRREGKRTIVISLCSEVGFADGHGPLEGLEVFKISNHDNSLAGSNPSLQPSSDVVPSTCVQTLFSLVGRKDAAIAIILVANIIVHILQRNFGANFTEELEETKPSDRAKRLCRLFSFAEIQSATDDFHDAFLIGKGGFGKVYKGIMNNGQEIVAIKRLKPNSKQGKREFWTEIETLSELRHVNLVSLIGYCKEQREMILVYEYMPCGTLGDHLYKLARKNNVSIPLSWGQRLKICIGAARGLDYLHTGNGIIHRDVKASNILLSEQLQAKVSDFGLAKVESRSVLQSQVSTHVKGTFGYLDPDYFRTRTLTTKSDTYSFGVVLLEILCSRPAVEPWAEEDKRSLTMWARDKISKGEVVQIVDPSLVGEIVPDSLITFIGIAEKCLHDEPKKRPAIAHVIINLELALEQQENVRSLVPNGIASVADFFPSNDRAKQNTSNSLANNEMENAAEVLSMQENTLIEGAGPAAAWTSTDDRNIPATSTRPSTVTFSTMQSFASPMTGHFNSKVISDGKKQWRKNPMRKLTRLLPFDAVWNTIKSSKKEDVATVSAPVSRRTGKMISRGSNIPKKRMDVTKELIPTPSLRIFSLSELKAATRNFSTVIGQGGFGTVYRGSLKGNSTAQIGGENLIAVKSLNSGSMQGIEEWKTEVMFLGKLSHPNLVKLLGYCVKDDNLLIVYEFLTKGSLDVHLFKGVSAGQLLPWDMRLRILIGAARGLAFLHSLDSPIICRDFKTSNILLDDLYNPKLSDFGLAKDGPVEYSHVSTRVVGTFGYAAPEYIATGHLYIASDVYSYGVVVVEMLTGSRPYDTNRPPGKQNLIEWIKPQLVDKRKLKNYMDPRLDGRYSSPAVFEIAKLTRKCLSYEPKSRPSMQEIVESLEAISFKFKISEVELVATDLFQKSK